MPLSEDYLVVAKIVGFYGLRGQVKLKLFTESLDSFKAMRAVYANINDTLKPLTLKKIGLQGQSVIASFTELHDRTAAETLGKVTLVTHQNSLPELPSDEFYWKDLLGLAVKNDVGLLGVVDGLMETGSNDVLVVKPTAGSVDDKERLIPYLEHVVKAVSLEKRLIIVDWDAEF